MYYPYGPSHGYHPGMHGMHGAPYQAGANYMYQNKQNSEVSPENNAAQDSQLNEDQQADDNKSYASSQNNKQQHPIDESQSTQKALMMGQLDENNQINHTGKTKQLSRQAPQSQNFKNVINGANF